MAQTIDSLEVKINASLGDVNQKLDRLVNKLSQVSKALKSIEDGKAFEPFTESSKNAEKSANNIQKSTKKILRSFEEIKASSQGVIDASKKWAENFVDRSSTEEIQNEIKRVAKALDEAKIKMAKSQGDAKKSMTFENAVKSVIEYEAKLKTLEGLLSDISARVDAVAERGLFSGSGTNYAPEELIEGKRVVEDIESEVEAVNSSLSETASGVTDVVSSTENATNSFGRWQNVAESVKVAFGLLGEGAMSVADNILNSFSETEPRMTSWRDSVSLVKEGFFELGYAVTESIDNVKNADWSAPLNTLKEKVDDVASTVTERLGRAFENTKAKAKGINLALKEKGVKSGVLTYTQEYVNLQKAIDKTRAHLSDLQNQQKRHVETGGKASDKTYQKMTHDIKQANSELKQMQALQSRMQMGKDGKAYKFNEAFSIFSGKGSAGSFMNTAQKAVTSVKRLGGAIASSVGRMSAYRKSVKESKKSTDKFSLANINLAKSLLKTSKMLKLMVVRMALRTVINGVTEGFKNVVQYSDKLNASVSLLWNSFRQLNNSLGAMVAPLINALAPALNYIIQLLINAVNWVNQLVSALTGASTWIKAKKLTDSYADSLDKSKKNADKLKKSVMGFDELNQLTDNTDSSSENKVADMFETEEVDSKVSDFAKKLKKMWEDVLEPIKKAWSNIGSFIVDSFKSTAEKLKSLFADIAKDWLEVWNQPKTQEVIERVLEIFGRIVRIVGILADKIREAWNYNDNGKKFLEAIRDILYVIVTWLDKAVERTESWAKKLDLKPLFTSITEYMKSLESIINAVMGVLYDFYSEVLLPLGKWTLESGLPQFIDILKEFNDSVDWEHIRESLNKVWIALEPFAEKVGQGLLDFFDYLMGKVSEFLNSDLLDTIIESFANFVTFLSNLEFNVDLTSLDESFTNFLESLEPVVQSIEGMLEDFVEHFLKPLAEWTIGEGLPSLLDMVTNLNNMGLFENLRQAFSDLWDILEPFAEKVAEGLVIFIGNVGEALNNFLMSDAWEWFIETLKDWANNIDADDIARDLHNIAGAILVFEGLKGALKVMSGIGGAIQGLVKAVSFVEANAGILSVLTGIGSIIAGLITSIASFVDMWKNGWSAIKAVIEAVGVALVAVGAIILGAPALVTAVIAGIVYAVSQLAIVIHDNWDKIKEWFSETVESIKEAWGKAVSWIGEKVSAVVQFFADCKDKVVDKFKSMVSFVQTNVINPFVNAWKTAVESIKGFFEGLWQGIKTGVKGAMNGAISIVEGMINGVIKAINLFLGGINKLASGIGDLLDKDWGNFGQLNTVKLPRFASGGFPADGQLFVGNENGIEMMGRMGNKNVVANNGQIVDGIKKGVYEAVAMAMSTSNAGNNGNASYINNTIQIDGETIARAVTKGQRSIDRRYNPSLA